MADNIPEGSLFSISLYFNTKRNPDYAASVNNLTDVTLTLMVYDVAEGNIPGNLLIEKPVTVPADFKGKKTISLFDAVITPGGKLFVGIKRNENQANNFWFDTFIYTNKTPQKVKDSHKTLGRLNNGKWASCPGTLTMRYELAIAKEK